MHYLALAAVSLVQIFAMAFQSKNINGGHYMLAAIGSIFIGLSQVYVWRVVTTAGSGLSETLVYSISGGAGCVLAMYAHRKFVKARG